MISPRMLSVWLLAAAAPSLSFTPLVPQAREFPASGQFNGDRLHSSLLHQKDHRSRSSLFMNARIDKVMNLWRQGAQPPPWKASPSTPAPPAAANAIDPPSKPEVSASKQSSKDKVMNLWSQGAQPPSWKADPLSSAPAPAPAAVAAGKSIEPPSKPEVPAMDRAPMQSPKATEAPSQVPPKGNPMRADPVDPFSGRTTVAERPVQPKPVATPKAEKPRKSTADLLLGTRSPLPVKLAAGGSDMGGRKGAGASATKPSTAPRTKSTERRLINTAKSAPIPLGLSTGGSEVFSKSKGRTTKPVSGPSAAKPLTTGKRDPLLPIGLSTGGSHMAARSKGRTDKSPPSGSIKSQSPVAGRRDPLLPIGLAAGGSDVFARSKAKASQPKPPASPAKKKAAAPVRRDPLLPIGLAAGGSDVFNSKARSKKTVPLSTVRKPPATPKGDASLPRKVPGRTTADLLLGHRPSPPIGSAAERSKKDQRPATTGLQTPVSTSSPEKKPPPVQPVEPNSTVRDAAPPPPVSAPVPSAPYSSSFAAQGPAPSGKSYMDALSGSGGAMKPASYGPSKSFKPSTGGSPDSYLTRLGDTQARSGDDVPAPEAPPSVPTTPLASAPAPSSPPSTSEGPAPSGKSYMEALSGSGGAKMKPASYGPAKSFKPSSTGTQDSYLTGLRDAQPLSSGYQPVPEPPKVATPPPSPVPVRPPIPSTPSTQYAPSPPTSPAQAPAPSGKSYMEALSGSGGAMKPASYGPSKSFKPSTADSRDSYLTRLATAQPLSSDYQPATYSPPATKSSSPAPASVSPPVAAPAPSNPSSPSSTPSAGSSPAPSGKPYTEALSGAGGATRPSSYWPGTSGYKSPSRSPVAPSPAPIPSPSYTTPSPTEQTPVPIEDFYVNGTPVPVATRKPSSYWPGTNGYRQASSSSPGPAPAVVPDFITSFPSPEDKEENYVPAPPKSFFPQTTPIEVNDVPTKPFSPADARQRPSPVPTPVMDDLKAGVWGGGAKPASYWPGSNGYTGAPISAPYSPPAPAPPAYEPPPKEGSFVEATVISYERTGSTDTAAVEVETMPPPPVPTPAPSTQYSPEPSHMEQGPAPSGGSYMDALSGTGGAPKPSSYWPVNSGYRTGASPNVPPPSPPPAPVPTLEPDLAENHFSPQDTVEPPAPAKRKSYSPFSPKKQKTKRSNYLPWWKIW